jgi:hypothetical protein
MKIYGYANERLEPAETKPSELAEITLVANPNELRLIAQFLENSARGMEERGKQWEHEHLSDKYRQFEDSPHFVIFNPEAEL